MAFVVVLLSGCSDDGPRNPEGRELLSIGVSPAHPAIAIGTGVQLTATGVYSDGSKRELTPDVVWSSSDPKVVLISNELGRAGFARALAAGTVPTPASRSGLQGGTAVKVTSATLKALTVTPPNPTMALGTTLELHATGTFSDSTTQDLTTQVTWSSSNEAIATVSNKPGSEGVVRSVAAGDVRVTATFGSVSGATAVHVTSGQLTSVAITPTNPTVAVGTTLQLQATGTFSDGTTQDLTAQAQWTSADPGVVQVSSDPASAGQALGLAAGIAEVIATVLGVTGKTSVTVSGSALQAVAISPLDPTVGKGTKLLLQAIATYGDGTSQDVTASATWTSSGPAVVVSNAPGEQGHAVAAELGPATVTATVGGVSGTTRVTVTDATVASVTISPAAPSMGRTTTLQLTATATFTDGSTLDVTRQATWSSSDPAVAAVSNADANRGLASGLEGGTVTITASFSGVDGTTELTVTSAELASITVTPANQTIAVSTKLEMVAMAMYADGTTQDLTKLVTWTSSDPAVATISNAAGSNGLVSALAAGSITLSAALGGVTGSTPLVVSNSALTSITLTPTNPSIAAGTTVRFQASGVFSDGTTRDLSSQVTWISSEPAVAAISNALADRGTARGLTAGSAKISAVLSNVSQSTSLVVTAVSLAYIAVTPTDPTIAQNTTIQLRAIGNYSDSSTQDITAQVTWSSASPAVATISNGGDRGTAFGVAAGTTAITATLQGRTGSTQLTVTGSTLVSLAVTPTNPTLAQGSELRFGAAGTYSDGTTRDLTTQVTWSSSNTAAAVISNAGADKGLATALAQGSTTISALMEGVTGTTQLVVSGATITGITISPADVAVADGSQQRFVAMGTFSDGSTQDVTAQTTWTSSNTEVATVSNALASRGLATAVAPGTATITATLQGASGTATMRVTGATLTSLTPTPVNPSISVGGTVQLRATAGYSDGTARDVTEQATWTSTNTSVATISNASGERGLATGRAAGETVVNVTLEGVTGTTSLFVTGATLASIAVTPANHTVAAGATQPYAATGTYSDGSSRDITRDVTWRSSNGGVATISNAGSSKGLATGVGAGQTTISALLAGVTGATTLTVTAATLASIAVTPANPSVAEGETVQLRAVGTFSDGDERDITAQVTWTSAAASVATISNRAGSKGLATAVNDGTTTITAAQSGVTGSTQLTVTPAAVTLTSVSVTPATATVAQGGTRQLTATAAYSDGSSRDVTSEATWSSSNPSVATVSSGGSSRGLATGVSPGTATLTASFGGESDTATLQVTAAAPTLTSIAVTPASASVAEGGSRQFTATGTYSDGSTANVTSQVTWSSSSTSVATISNSAATKGLATGQSAGTTTITAALEGKSDNATLTVATVAPTLSSIAVTPATASVAEGTTRQLTATATYSDGSTANVTSQASWSSSDTAVATVSSTNGTKGLATGRAAGTATITAAFGGQSGSATLTVTAAAPAVSSVAVTPASASLEVGGDVDLTATATMSDGSTRDVTSDATWTSTDTGVATVNGSGRVRGQAAGSATVRATHGGKAGSASVTVTAAGG